MLYYLIGRDVTTGLTLTLDVFKYKCKEELQELIEGLTLTLDVFKFNYTTFNKATFHD